MNAALRDLSALALVGLLAVWLIYVWIALDRLVGPLVPDPSRCTVHGIRRCTICLVPTDERP